MHKSNINKKTRITKSSAIGAVFGFNPQKPQALPLFIARVAAGFPSPADDYIDDLLDLNQLLIEHPAATFFVRVEGDSMINAGINSGDLLIVDRALTPKDNDVVVAILNGELTVKRIRKIENMLYLWPENKNFAPIKITPAMDFEIWGVAVHVIHTLR